MTPTPRQPEERYNWGTTWDAPAGATWARLDLECECEFGYRMEWDWKVSFPKSQEAPFHVVALFVDDVLSRSSSMERWKTKADALTSGFGSDLQEQGDRWSMNMTDFVWGADGIKGNWSFFVTIPNALDTQIRFRPSVTRTEVRVSGSSGKNLTFQDPSAFKPIPTKPGNFSVPLPSENHAVIALPENDTWQRRGRSLDPLYAFQTSKRWHNFTREPHLPFFNSTGPERSAPYPFLISDGTENASLLLDFNWHPAVASGDRVFPYVISIPSAPRSASTWAPR